MPATHRDYPRFRLLASGKVQQADASGTTDFDPQDWAEYEHTAGVAVYRPGQGFDPRSVRAVRIPCPFVLGGEVCSDGWLVRDHRGLKAVGAATFSRDYEQPMTLDNAA